MPAIVQYEHNAVDASIVKMPGTHPNHHNGNSENVRACFQAQYSFLQPARHSEDDMHWTSSSVYQAEHAFSPEIGGELNIPVGHNVLWHTIETRILSLKRAAPSGAMSVSTVGMKWTLLVSLSTTTKMEV